MAKSLLTCVKGKHKLYSQTAINCDNFLEDIQKLSSLILLAILVGAVEHWEIML